MQIKTKFMLIHEEQRFSHQAFLILELFKATEIITN